MYPRIKRQSTFKMRGVDGWMAGLELQRGREREPMQVMMAEVAPWRGGKRISPQVIRRRTN